MTKVGTGGRSRGVLPQGALKGRRRAVEEAGGQLGCVDAVAEPVGAARGEHRDVMAVAREERGVGADIDALQRQSDPAVEVVEHVLHDLSRPVAQ